LETGSENSSHVRSLALLVGYSGVDSRVFTRLIIRILVLTELLKVWERDVTIWRELVFHILSIG
jgi:hypothetical protein